MTETREDDRKPVTLRDMSSVRNTRDKSNKDRLSGPPKSPFSSGLSNRDSGIGNDSPASVNTSGHFLFGEDLETSHERDFESSGNVDDSEVFDESGTYAGSPSAASTPVTQPIAIPRRQNASRGITSTVHRPLTHHRYSTGMFGNFPGEVNTSRNIATQTPSPSSQLIDRAVNWQLGSDEYEFGALPIEPDSYPTARGTAVAYLRECTTPCEVFGNNLPDLVQIPARARALSESHIQPYRRDLELRNLGQELQRLGDDFHSSYQELRNTTIREEEPPELPSSFPGAAQAERGWWVKFKTALSPTKTRKDEDEKDKPKKS